MVRAGPIATAHLNGLRLTGLPDVAVGRKQHSTQRQLVSQLGQAKTAQIDTRMSQRQCGERVRKSPLEVDQAALGIKDCSEFHGAGGCQLAQHRDIPIGALRVVQQSPIAQGRPPPTICSMFTAIIPVCTASTAQSRILWRVGLCAGVWKGCLVDRYGGYTATAAGSSRWYSLRTTA